MKNANKRRYKNGFDNVSTLKTPSRHTGNVHTTTNKRKRGNR